VCPRHQIRWYEEEKRNYPRFPLAVEIRVARLSLLELPEQPQSWLLGTTENIGRGGVAMFSDQLLPVNTVVRGEIAISGNPVRIPTLLTVRWYDKVEGEDQYKLGLQFLL
jgi:hypothetical protein